MSLSPGDMACVRRKFTFRTTVVLVNPMCKMLVGQRKAFRGKIRADVGSIADMLHKDRRSSDYGGATLNP